MMSIITAILPIALQVLGWFLNKSAADNETKKLFFDFVRRAGNDFGSTKLMKYGDEQIQWFKDNPWPEKK
jgi:hypothetical protein